MFRESTVNSSSSSSARRYSPGWALVSTTIYHETFLRHHPSVLLYTTVESGAWLTRLVCVVPGIPAGQLDNCGSISSSGKKCVSCASVQSSCGGHSVFIQREQEDCPWGQSGRGMMLTIHIHLMPNLRLNGAITLFPLTFSWREKGQSTLAYNPVIRHRITSVTDSVVK
jgi:hypothetical protein